MQYFFHLLHRWKTCCRDVLDHAETNIVVIASQVPAASVLQFVSYAALCRQCEVRLASGRSS